MQRRIDHSGLGAEVGELLDSAQGWIGFAGKVQLVPVVSKAGGHDQRFEKGQAVGKVDARDIFSCKLLGDESSGTAEELRPARGIESVARVFCPECCQIFPAKKVAVVTELSRGAA